MKTPQWDNSRQVIERVFVTATLKLISPAHFGNGSSKSLTDIPLLRDELENRPLLTGASIAGAMRSYLLAYQNGYGVAEKQDGSSLAEKLFGYLHDQEDASVESWLFIDDALGTFPSGRPTELRDGVAIQAKSRTAEDKKKFDIELLAAGTTFDLGFELWLTAEGHAELLEAFTIAFNGLKNGDVHLGMRKRRGFGKVALSDIRVNRYKMNQPADVIKWLEKESNQGSLPEVLRENASVSFELEANFILDKSSLLIRSNTGKGGDPDIVHLRSLRNGVEKPVLSGTSAAGAIRGRALRIAKTLMGDYGTVFVDEMFGKRIENSIDDPTGSLVTVEESEIDPGNAIIDRVQSRVKIDRFTGGAYPGALFAEQPVFSKDQDKTAITINIALQRAERNKERFDAQVGLLLMVLKDLWTGDLPLGGEQSVGRGRLTGKSAKMSIGSNSWRFDGSPIPELEKYAKALKEVRHA